MTWFFDTLKRVRQLPDSFLIIWKKNPKLESTILFPEKGFAAMGPGDGADGPGTKAMSILLGMGEAILP